MDLLRPIMDWLRKQIIDFLRRPVMDLLRPIMDFINFLVVFFFSAQEIQEEEEAEAGQYLDECIWSWVFHSFSDIFYFILRIFY